MSRLFFPATLGHPWALSCFAALFRFNSLQKVRGRISQRMRVGIPFLAPSEVVKLLECAEKNMDRAGTFPGEPYQLVGFSRLCFAMQLLHEEVTDTLADSLGWAISVVFPLPSPGVCRQLIKVRK